MRYCYIFLFLLLPIVSAKEESNNFIHPLAFYDVLCWLSDTEEPYVTEFSISAVKTNRNKFPYDEVEIHGNIYKHSSEKNKMSIWYTKTENKGTIEVTLYVNGGGSLTTKHIITGKILSRTISNKTIEVFKVIGFKSVGRS